MAFFHGPTRKMDFASPCTFVSFLSLHACWKAFFKRPFVMVCILLLPKFVAIPSSRPHAATDTPTPLRGECLAVCLANFLLDEMTVDLGETMQTFLVAASTKSGRFFLAIRSLMSSTYSLNVTWGVPARRGSDRLEQMNICKCGRLAQPATIPVEGNTPEWTIEYHLIQRGNVQKLRASAPHFREHLYFIKSPPRTARSTVS